MVGAIFGLLIGSLSGFVFWGVALMLDDCMPFQFRGVMNVVGIVVAIAIIIMSPFIGYAIEGYNNQKSVEEVVMTSDDAIEVVPIIVDGDANG